MKIKLLAASILLLFNTTFLFGQNGYFENNPVWSMSSVCAYHNCSAPTCLEYKYYNYYLSGDTTINNHGYKKLFIKGTGYFVWQNFPTPTCCQGNFTFFDTVNVVAYLRDTLKRIYIIDHLNTMEQLLYDFNLAIGDTLPITYNNWDTAVVVTEIDSILVSNFYRKKFKLSGAGINNNLYLTEGIGAESGLLEPMYVHFDCGFSLFCYSLNDTGYYPAPGPTCNNGVGIRNQENYNSEILIFPNPSSNFIKINFGWKKSIFYSVRIVNSFAQMEFFKTYPQNSNIQIDVSNFSSGIYFLELILENERVIKKFVKE